MSRHRRTCRRAARASGRHAPGRNPRSARRRGDGTAAGSRSRSAGWPYRCTSDHSFDRRQSGRRRLQRALQRVGVHREMDRIDIDQQRRCAGHFDRGDRRDGGVGDGHDGAPWSDVEPAQAPARWHPSHCRSRPPRRPRARRRIRPRRLFLRRRGYTSRKPEHGRRPRRSRAAGRDSRRRDWPAESTG